MNIYCVIKRLLAAVLVMAFLFLCFLLYMTVVDYKPEKEVCLFVNSENEQDTVDVNEQIKCITWNIGYAGLCDSMDFFYDGGHMVRPTYQNSLQCVESMSDFLQSKSECYIFVQEIDKDSKRSFGINQYDTFSKKINPKFSAFAKNYSVSYVPVPVFEPMGKVESGISVFAPKKPIDSYRYSYPVNFSWPLKVFMLDRCFLSSRFVLNNGKELFLINTHNSAFDDDGYLRKAELNMLTKFMKSEYEKGNYVIVGGDFNQCPSRFSPELIKNFDYDEFYTVPDSLLTDWNYVFDSTVASNRRVDIPLDTLRSRFTVIDFFITSPNVVVDSVKCIDLKFKNSDHNPVEAVFSLKH